MVALLDVAAANWDGQVVGVSRGYRQLVLTSGTVVYNTAGVCGTLTPALPLTRPLPLGHGPPLSHGPW
jgi:hypothetical protein